MPGFGDLGSRDENGAFRVVVEAPRGSHVKLKYEPTLGLFVFDRALRAGVAYPYDWGFVPGTIADDGDPLDALVLLDEPTWPGVIVPARPIGMVRLSQREKNGRGERERNDRIIAVAIGDPRYQGLRRLPRRTIQELEAFFVSASKLPRERVTVEGWSGPRAARAAILRAEARYRATHG